MLRIIHTGRAYEVIDDARYLRTRYRRQNDVLGETCRKVWKLKELLENTERQLRATKLELKSCQKSTLDTHESQDPR